MPRPLSRAAAPVTKNRRKARRVMAAHFGALPGFFDCQTKTFSSSILQQVFSRAAFRGPTVFLASFDPFDKALAAVPEACTHPARVSPMLLHQCSSTRLFMAGACYLKVRCSKSVAK